MDYSLVYFGHDVLKQKAQPVSQITDGTVKLVESMFDVMKKANGIGLAAPQVGVSERIIVIDLTGMEKREPLVLINPEIVSFGDKMGDYEEGCLSVPGIYADVIRPLELEVKGLDLSGKEVSYDAGKLFARVLQHEIDHLNGILFVDLLEDYVRKEFTQELKRIKKLNRL